MSEKNANAGKHQTFTILHTNDLHSAFIGSGPASDYSPITLDADAPLGGYARQATLIAQRRVAHEQAGPVLVVCAGGYSMGAPFGAATRESGGELQIMALMGYDVTTLGNHELDLGPDGLGKSMSVAAKTGRIPAVVATNMQFAAEEPTLADLQRLARERVIRRYLVLERGGIRFGVFGVLGKEASSLTTGAGAVSFGDPIETAREIVNALREIEQVDVIIALSHGGMTRGKAGQFEGEDIELAKKVPDIDVVIGGHSHSVVREPILVNGCVPVVQAGKNGEYLGELVLTLEDGKVAVESYQLHPINDTIPGDHAIADAIDKLKRSEVRAINVRRR